MHKGHYALLVNRSAFGYNEKAVARLVAAIRAHDLSYTVYEPSNALDLQRQAEVAAGLRQATQFLPRPYERGGKVTGLVACGGDGTFNLVARAAARAGLPIGHYPLGRVNSFANSFYGTADPARTIKGVLSSGAHAYDTAMAGNVPFFGSVGLGFVPQLLAELDNRPLPRLALGWAQLGARAASKVEVKRTVIKVDAFRFEIQPVILNINIVSYSAGLPLTPSSVPDDGQLEIIFDAGAQAGNFSSFTRLILKKKYLYGDEVRLYRGRAITIEPVAGRRLYLDGELIELPADILDIRIGDKKLQVLG